MSQENVELLRRGLTAWNAGDMDGVRDVCDPDIVMRPPEGWPESGPFIGAEAVMRQWAEQRKIWKADSVEPISDFIPGGEHAAVRQVWRGTGAGPDTDTKMTQVIRVRQGKIVEKVFYWDHDEALAAVGLAE
jgi:ketosteroid isomerase-like protein